MRTRPITLGPETLPPKELADEVERALFGDPKPPPPEMADSLPEGMTDDGVERQTPDQVLKLPEPTVFNRPRAADEEIPAFVNVSRVTLADQPKLTWLVARLLHRFPHVVGMDWFARLRAFMMDNAYFFMKTENAVLLATTARDPFAAYPYVWPIFLLERERGPEGGHLKDSQSEKDSIALMRELMRWGKHHRATEIRCISGIGVSDLPMGVLVNTLRADRFDGFVITIK
jgi:hypothetical protein